MNTVAPFSLTAPKAPAAFLAAGSCAHARGPLRGSRSGASGLARARPKFLRARSDRSFPSRALSRKIWVRQSRIGLIGVLPLCRAVFLPWEAWSSSKQSSNGSNATSRG